MLEEVSQSNTSLTETVKELKEGIVTIGRTNSEVVADNQVMLKDIERRLEDVEEASKEMVGLLRDLRGGRGQQYTPCQLYRNRRINVIYRHGLFEPKLLYMEKNMNPAEEKALKALNDVTEELRLMQEITCETSEEEQVRASEIEKLVASVEERSEDLAREQRSAAALAKVESVKSQVTKTGLVDPRQKRKPKSVLSTKRSCTDALKATTKAHALGRYVQSIAGIQPRAASPYPQASVDSIAAYGSGENATTFPTSMSALVMDTLYDGLINEVGYIALCPQLARIFNVPANGLQIPIADEAPYAKFYTELTHIDPVQPVVNAAQLDAAQDGTLELLLK